MADDAEVMEPEPEDPEQEYPEPEHPDNPAEADDEHGKLDKPDEKPAEEPA